MLKRKLLITPGANGIQRFVRTAAVTVCALLLLLACERKCAPGLVLKGKLCQRVDGAIDNGAGGPGSDAGNGLEQAGSGAMGMVGTVPSGSSGVRTGIEAGANGSNPGIGSNAGTGGSGVGNSTAGGVPSAGDSCTTADALRCSMSGAGNRDKCSNGTWLPDAPCAGGETCVTDASGKPSCVVVAELCRGSGGQTVCDAQGSLVVCNADESLSTMMACESAKHCMAGMISQTCATCIPTEEHQCTGALLEQCAPDGMSFTKLMDCETEGLCNAMLGQCTDALCEPGQKSCDGNNLVACNADGTAVEGTQPCANGMCDAVGGDCNECQPGMKGCEGDMAITCDPMGQMWQPMVCPSSTPKCVGLGQCVECADHNDCSELTQGCKVGRCNQNKCVAENAPNATMCQAAGGKPGMCAGGNCMCTPQCGTRQCGDNGCNGSCGSCAGQMCNGSGQCVECLDSGDCRATDDCQTASCSGGMCRHTDRNSGSCGSGGVCRSGSCCEPNCGSRECGAPPNGCGSSCGSCGGNEECNTSNGMCETPQVGMYETCEPGGANQQGNCRSGLTCQTIIRGGFGCYPVVVPGCEWDSTPRRSYMGVACLNLCDPMLPGASCNSPLVCDTGWCVMP